MKIIDTRDGTTLQGTPIAVLPANQPVSDQDMLRFYGLRPGSLNFDRLAGPQSLERVVLQRGDDPVTKLPSEPSFYIVPRYDFYRVENDD